MRFFPWFTEQFHSPLPPAELLQRLQAATAPPLTWGTMWQGQPKADFRGRVWGEGFEISRVITGRNSMLPQITGWVAPAAFGRGSQLRLRHRLQPLVMVLAVVWLGFAATGMLGLGSSLAVAKEMTPDVLVTLGLLVFGLLFFTVPFWLEVRRSRPLLVRLLRLEPLPPGWPRP